MQSLKSKNPIARRIYSVIRRICDRYRNKVSTSEEIADKTMKELALPTSNPTAVYLMQESLRQMTRKEMRYRHDDPEELATLEDEEREQGELFETIQDNYCVPRDGHMRQVPRNMLTEFERWAIIKRLRKIGAKYLGHADELQKETEALFSRKSA